MIHQPRGDGAPQDAIIPGRGRALGYRHAAALLDGLEAQGAIGASAREHDAHDVRTLGGGQRAEKSVDGRAMAVGLLGWRLHAQDAAADGQGGIRRDHVDMVGLNRCGRRHLSHRHPGILRQQRRQEARAVGGEVLDEHERHAAVRRHLREERLEDLQAPADAPIPTMTQRGCGPLCGRAAAACSGVCGPGEDSSCMACPPSKKHRRAPSW
jgi:hypothetical protein